MASTYAQPIHHPRVVSITRLAAVAASGCLRCRERSWVCWLARCPAGQVYSRRSSGDAKHPMAKSALRRSARREGCNGSCAGRGGAASQAGAASGAGVPAGGAAAGRAARLAELSCSLTETASSPSSTSLPVSTQAAYTAPFMASIPAFAWRGYTHAAAARGTHDTGEPAPAAPRRLPASAWTGERTMAVQTYP